MEAAALVAIALSNGGGRPPDWEDFVGIVLLLLANSAIGFYEERNAGNAVKALMDSLAPKAKVKRSGSWREIESADLVPGDMISFKIGDIVPADCRLTEAINVSIDQAALTGESLPQNKKLGDQCFSSVYSPHHPYFPIYLTHLLIFSEVQPVSRVKPKASSSPQVQTLSSVAQPLWSVRTTIPLVTCKKFSLKSAHSVSSPSASSSFSRSSSSIPRTITVIAMVSTISSSS